LPPLWTPLQVQNGRGLVDPNDPNGRIVSPQQLAYETLADELFYGGAGGGGKTDLIIGLAVTQHRNTAIFRREFKQFSGQDGIVERTRAIVGERGEVLQSLARNIDGRRAIEFNGVQTEADKNKYKGRPHDLKAYDELPEFSESQYRFLNGWLRTALPGQRCRVVATGNPPTDAEGEWIIRYWGPWLDPTHPNPARPGELRWYVTLDGKDVAVESSEPVWEESTKRFINPRSRTFIPARVEDNPHYMATGYASVLDSLPEPLRSQMRFGNFQATADDHPWQILPTAWVKAAQARWTETPPSGSILTAVGNDPSRGGKDKFCIALRYGWWIAPVKKHAGVEAPDGEAGVQLIINAMTEAIGRPDPTIPVGIDVIGSAGSSVYDSALRRDLNAVSLNGSETSHQKDITGKLGFFNKRAEWHWRMREWLDPNSGMDIALPPDREVLVDLCAPRWTMTPRGIKVEKKEEIIARIGRSPDVGESVIYAFAEDSSAGMGFLAWGAQVTPDEAKTARELAAAPGLPDDDKDNPWLQIDPDAANYVNRRD
jgi:hypothetical protein